MGGYYEGEYLMDTTMFSNLTSLQEVAYYSNDQTQGLLFGGGIVVLYFIMLLVLSKQDEPFLNSFTVSSWTMFILSAFLWLAHLCPSILVLAFLFLAGLGVLVLYASK